MNGRRRPRFARLGLALLGVAVALSCARAHEPFDISSRLVVHEDRLELTVTMGTAGMRRLLAAEGYAPDKIATVLQARGPEDIVEHPSTLAPRLLRLTIDGVPVGAQKVTSLAEGMEVILTVVYARPAGQKLEVRATGYQTIPELRKGVMRVTSEASAPLGAALFSAENPRLVVPLPPPTTKARP